jgi:hypothetical protein
LGGCQIEATGLENEGSFNSTSNEISIIDNGKFEENEGNESV